LRPPAPAGHAMCARWASLLEHASVPSTCPSRRRGGASGPPAPGGYAMRARRPSLLKNASFYDVPLRRVGGRSLAVIARGKRRRHAVVACRREAGGGKPRPYGTQATVASLRRSPGLAGLLVVPAGVEVDLLEILEELAASVPLDVFGQRIIHRALVAARVVSLYRSVCAFSFCRQHGRSMRFFSSSATSSGAPKSPSAFERLLRTCAPAEWTVVGHPVGSCASSASTGTDGDRGWPKRKEERWSWATG
jgi:hypothetical protein